MPGLPLLVGRLEERADGKDLCLLMMGRVSGVMGPVATGLAAGPRLLSEEEEETEPLRAETALGPPPAPPKLPLDTHCDCLHAARAACRADLSGVWV